MFKKPTTFVLGAGASWHYGYPTGVDLVAQVTEVANELALFFRDCARANNPFIPTFVTAGRPQHPAPTSSEAHEMWFKAHLQAKSLHERLREVNPTLIDYFLTHDPDLHGIGTLAIAIAILRCEQRYRDAGGNPNHAIIHNRRVRQGLARPVELDASVFNDDWLRFVLYKITTNCVNSADLLENDVTFVTFNYDVSLETRLFAGLSNIKRFLAKDIQSFFTERRFVHVYGSIRADIRADGFPIHINLPSSLAARSPDQLNDFAQQLNKAYEASLGIRTIDGLNKEEQVIALETARREIRRAHSIYILGYGFDASNNKRIALGETANISRKVFLTNFGGSNRISRAAGKVLVGKPGAFSYPSSLSYHNTRTTPAGVYSDAFEMSAKNVYDAMDQDFESLEVE